ncbi:thioredoxin family protein [Methanococcoides burtonii]|uniref:Thioredoxin family protein n=1 Tax=Methanococcoides burtonii (strain DSM 6242 / NBRC 107633 / OCM 468 / ACE-M) TaxID=259564 RepID=Q12TL9_METBU|nr:thioredoxin family protein [Methanococcoides burtonii]ABE53207.1 thioredoxin family protein [Methanococcoides burtonii DSM 6242]
MKLEALVITLLTLSVLLAGCVSDVTPIDAEYDANDRDAILVTEKQQIDDALVNGPVLLKIGAEWCPPCTQLDPVLDELAMDYEGRATIMYIDSGITSGLAAQFKYYSIPDTTVIAGIEDGSYLFMRRDGVIDTSRNKARILGYVDISVLETVLDHAIEYHANTSE